MGRSGEYILHFQLKILRFEANDAAPCRDDCCLHILGVPEMSQIPLQFTHAAHKQLKEHFKDVVEWMVHKKVNPAFNKDDPMYRQAFAKMSDEVSGLATSKFISTQWTAEFTRALKARPELHERGLADGEGLNEEGIPKCDVCNHRKHYPKYGISLKGKAYSMVSQIHRSHILPHGFHNSRYILRATPSFGRCISMSHVAWNIEIQGLEGY